jgi:hypothetical protein
MEIPYFVDADAFCRIDPNVTRDKSGQLGAFDLYRARIFEAADKV